MNNCKYLSRVTKLVAAYISVALFSATANAADCYDITGWSSTDYAGARPLLTQTSCAITPQGEAWLVPIGSPVNNVFLRISLSDSRMSNGIFKPLIRYLHYDPATSVPVYETDFLPCGNCDNSIQSTVNPPVQGDIIAIGARNVRLRHWYTGLCLVTSDANGDRISTKQCEGHSSELFQLISTGTENGKRTYRLRNIDDDQCLYAQSLNGAPSHHWGCWPDPNMRFHLVPFNGGYLLHHVQTNQCLYVYNVDKKVYNWGCWNDPNMVFKVDIVSRNIHIGPKGRIGPD